MKIYNDFPLSHILYYKIGGKARILIEAQNRNDVLEALDYIQKNHIKKLLVVGTGANLLVSDEYYDGAVIRIVSDNKPEISVSGEGLIQVFAGSTIDDVIQFSFERRLKGLEWAGGLPGTVGAGIRGNVGAFGGEIKNSFYKAEIIHILNDGFNVVEMENSDLNFGYRESLVKKNKNLVILTSTFNLEKTGGIGVEKARETYLSNIDYRKSRHPLEYANCGSVFKNIIKDEDIKKIIKAFPEVKELTETKWHGKISTGYLIGKFGFSGFQIGHAKVSEKHNNFIVNLGEAKFSDVKGVIDAIQHKFEETLGFRPETEVEIIQ